MQAAQESGPCGLLALRRSAAPLSVNPVVTGGPGGLGPQTRGRLGPARTAASGRVGRQRVPDWKQRGYVSGSAPEPPISNGFQKRVCLSAVTLRGLPNPSSDKSGSGGQQHPCRMLQPGGKEPRATADRQAVNTAPFTSVQ